MEIIVRIQHEAKLLDLTKGFYTSCWRFSTSLEKAKNLIFRLEPDCMSTCPGVFVVMFIVVHHLWCTAPVDGQLFVVVLTGIMKMGQIFTHSELTFGFSLAPEEGRLTIACGCVKITKWLTVQLFLCEHLAGWGGWENTSRHFRRSLANWFLFSLPHLDSAVYRIREHFVEESHVTLYSIIQRTWLIYYGRIQWKKLLEYFLKKKNIVASTEGTYGILRNSHHLPSVLYLNPLCSSVQFKALLASVLNLQVLPCPTAWVCTLSVSWNILVCCLQVTFSLAVASEGLCDKIMMHI